MKKLFFFLSELKSTFWFIPVLIIALSALMAFLLVYVDISINFHHQGLYRYFFVNNPDSARSILSTISGAMIGVAGTVFSVTLVALTLASSQFGPRLVKNFMYVRLNQVVLGSYIATYVYCLIVLNTIKDTDYFVFVPSLSIIIAILMAVLNIVLLIVFIHRIAVSIQADNVIADISQLITRHIKDAFPTNIDEDRINKEMNLNKFLSKYQKSISISADRGGYIQYIDAASIVAHAESIDGICELFYRQGNYVVKGMEIGKIYYNSKVEEKDINKILSDLILGKFRTSKQDIEFSIHQMVEIASRALSPGVNDPYTAIACIDNLTTSLCHLTNSNFPAKFIFDKEDNLRLILDVISFEGVLDAAFNQIRQFSKGSTAVQIRLMDALNVIYAIAKDPKHRKAVKKHADMMVNTAKENIKEPNDLNDLMHRYKNFTVEDQIHNQNDSSLDS